MERIRSAIDDFLAGWGLTAVDVVIPFAILFFGWIAAVLVGRATRKLLEKTSFDDRLAEWIVGKEKAKRIETARWFGRFMYWVVMLVVLAAFLVRLELAIAAEPINAFLTQVFDFAPRLLAAIGLAFVAWVVARLVRRLVLTAIEKSRLDDKVAEESGLARSEDGAEAAVQRPPRTQPSQAISEAAYWLVFLFFLPAILGILELEGILRPVEGMVDEFLGFMPNLFSALVILVAGWFVAKVVQRIVTSVLSAAGLDRAATRYGVDKALGDKRISEIVGMVVHVLVIIPVAVAALNALQLEAVTKPASQMLTTMLDSLPNIFGASLVVGISFFVGKFVAGLVSNILRGAGFDRILVRLGLAKSEPDQEKMTPSNLGGVLVLAGIMLFASIEAANLLGFEVLAVLIANFITLAGHIALGIAILGLGLLFAEVAAQAVRGSEVRHAKILATAARLAIILLAGAMGLRQMGLANEIIVLAFGLTLGAVAVAAALAFGLGSRDVAGSIAAEWRERWRSDR